MSQTKAQLLDNIKDNVQLDARNSLRFADTDSSHYVAFKAPATVSSNVTWTLPAADGSANYVLATDGSGTLSWIADPAGQWVTSSSNIYFTGGNVGIGDNSPSNPLSVTGASAFNGDVQFTGAAANVTWDKSADDLIFNDNAKAVFGTSSDGLEIYHSGTGSYIVDQGTGDLILRASDQLKIQETDNGESMAIFNKDGEVQLFFNNSEKLNTVTGGINVTGNLEFADDTNTYLARPASDTLAITTAGSERLRIASNGLVTINADTYDGLTINTTENGTNGPQLQLTHISASPAAADTIGQIRFSGKDSAGNTDLMGKIETIIDSPTSGAETAYLQLGTRGLGSYNPILRLKNRSSASAPSYTADDINGIILDVYNTGNPYPRYMNFIAKSGGDTDSNVGFWTESVGGSPTEKLRITSGGDVEVQTGNLVIGTAGKGIDFSAQTSSSATGATTGDEVLNHYEEGTWTPAADGGGTISGTSITYAGSYTKIGNLVHCHFGATNSAGDIQISSYKTFSGLPFATTSGKSGTGRAMTEDGEVTARQGDISAAGSTFLINACGSSSGTVNLKGCFTYQTDS